MNEGPPQTDSVIKSSKWQPLNRLQRRVLGVLVEKSKTTPDVYPMTLTAITTGSNQKSNRSPLMELQQDEVAETLDSLRALGAVTEIQGDGRVPKYKHMMYEWMGIDRPESAVMTELLLRGHQTLGELRARAARMESAISDLNELRPILDRLLGKGLLIELTPTGRGQIVSHKLYQPEELAKIKAVVEAEKGAPAATDVLEMPGTTGGISSTQPDWLARLEQLESLVEAICQRLGRLERSE